MLLTSTASGAMERLAQAGSQTYPVTADNTYGVQAQFEAANSTRSRASSTPRSRGA
jgi:hypothetical protein